MKQYIYTAGPYTEFRGYPFVNGKPTEIRDQGTIDALERRVDFKRFQDPEPVPAVFRRPILRARNRV